MASGHPLHWWEGTCIPAVAQTASCDPRPLPISSARPWPWALRLPAGEALGQPPGLLPPQNWLKSPLPPQGVLLLWEVQTALAPGGLTPHWLSQERSRWEDSVQSSPPPMCSARLPRDPATLISYALHTQHIGCKCGWPNRTGTGGARGRLRFHQWPFASASRGATAVEWTEGLAPRLLESLRHLPASHHNGFLGTLHPKPGRAPWEHGPKATQSPGGQAPRLNHAGQRGPGLTHHYLGQLGRGDPSSPRHRSGGEA